MKRVLVTGGAGAIGSNLCRALLGKGYEVIVLDDLSSGDASFLPEGIDFIEGSVTEEKDLCAAFEKPPQYVLHAAALFANQNSVDHPERDLQVNGLGTLKVLQACAKSGVEKLVYFSSSCVYGPTDNMKEECATFEPETPYAITKLMGEYYAGFWARQHKLNVATVRIFNTYGPGELPGPYRNVIPNFLNRAMKKQALTITGTGKETRSFLYVTDTVAGILAVLSGNTQPGSIYNIGSDKEIAIKDLACLVNQITKNPTDIEFKPRRDWDNVLRRSGNASRAQREFGFEPKVGLEQGLQLTYEWLQGLDRGECV